MTVLKWTTLCLVPLALASWGCSHQVSFKNDVHPILIKHCSSCHSPGGEGYAASGFNVMTYKSVMKGTKYAQVIVPGSAIGSTLMTLIEHRASPKIAMPRSHHPGAPADSLTKQQIKLIGTWIDQGAKDN